jgi:hypothetical protein
MGRRSLGRLASFGRVGGKRATAHSRVTASARRRLSRPTATPSGGDRLSRPTWLEATGTTLVAGIFGRRCTASVGI